MEKTHYFFSMFEVLGLWCILNLISTIIAGTSGLRIKGSSWNHAGSQRGSQTSFNFMYPDADLNAQAGTLKQ